MALFGKKNDGAVSLVRELQRSRRYHSLGALGEGGIADIERRFDAHLNRIIAVKRLKTNSLDNPDLVRAFINEAKLIGYLDHPGVIPIYDSFVENGDTLCYAMKLVEGKSLCDGLTELTKREGQTTSLIHILRVFERLCETMAAVHDRGVLHLDLKPDNILLGHYGEVMIMDWGNARIYDLKPWRENLEKFGGSAEMQEFAEESTNLILGTPTYMSPEQTNTPRGNLTPASDIFSAGIILYEMLCGTNPFHTDSPGESMTLVREKTPLPPNEVNSEIPKRVSQLCERMLEKDISRRYASFSDILADLADVSSSGQAFTTKSFLAGETIFSQGDAGDYAFTIVTGTIEISREYDGQKSILASLGKGEIVGELAIFTGQPRSATAVAKEPTIIRIMNRADIESELEKMSPWVGTMIEALSQRFTRLNERVFKLDLGKHEYAETESILKEFRSDTRTYTPPARKKNP